MPPKKQKAKNLRNILVSPLNIHWSESTSEGVEAVQKVLEELLPLAKLERKSLKPISKEAKATNCTEKRPSKKHSNIFRRFLAPGFQSVIRGLEKSELCCVLMAGDINPPMIPRVVCSYCHTHDIPLVIIPHLKAITKTSLGFPTMVLGLKKVVDSPENQFFPIYDVVSQNQSVLKAPFDSKKIEETIPKKEERCTFIKNKILHDSTTKIEDFYLYRDKGNDRVFRPCVDVNCEANLKAKGAPKDGMDADFIGFDKNERKSSRHSSMINPKTTYGHNMSDKDDSDCDSVDEDNMFFVDDKPDQMLLDTDPSGEELGSQNYTGERGDQLLKTDKTIMKSKTTNERYFDSQVKQNNKSKKKSSKPKLEAVKSDKMITLKQPTSTAYNALTIKTIISNPKKIKRKKR